MCHTISHHNTELSDTLKGAFWEDSTCHVLVKNCHGVRRFLPEIKHGGDIQRVHQPRRRSTNKLTLVQGCREVTIVERNWEKDLSSLCGEDVAKHHSTFKRKCPPAAQGNDSDHLPQQEFDITTFFFLSFSHLFWRVAECSRRMMVIFFCVVLWYWCGKGHGMLDNGNSEERRIEQVVCVCVCACEGGVGGKSRNTLLDWPGLSVLKKAHRKSTLGLSEGTVLSECCRGLLLQTSKHHRRRSERTLRSANLKAYGNVFCLFLCSELKIKETWIKIWEGGATRDHTETALKSKLKHYNSCCYIAVFMLRGLTHRM